MLLHLLNFTYSTNKNFTLKYYINLLAKDEVKLYAILKLITFFQQ